MSETITINFSFLLFRQLSVLINSQRNELFGITVRFRFTRSSLYGMNYVRYERVYVQYKRGCAVRIGYVFNANENVEYDQGKS